jgi:hypothetical protein
MRWAVLLVLLGIAAGRPLFADPSAGRAVIERCAREADASLRGLDALSHSCPEIGPAAHELGLDPLLPPDWQKTTSARALANLAALADRYTAPAPDMRLDGARLRMIARTLEPPRAPPSLWERIMARVRAWLEPKTESASSWLRFLPNWHLSQRLARLMLEALAALIVIGIAALVVNELKASGLIGGNRYRGSPRRPGSEARPTAEASLDLDALDSAVPRERPALLLRLLVRALTRSHRLGNDRDLTYRELIAKARFDSVRQREQFEDVALLAERALYGDPARAPPAIPDQMLKEARSLHAELLSAPRFEPTSS